jgi:DNA invertase Pin-like site-specific DNA recombinase
MVLYGYIRVSTDMQVETGNGINAQMDACTKWASQNVLTVQHFYIEGAISGASSLEKRPVLLDAISRLGAGDTLLVATRDRIGRDTFVIAMIEAAVKRQKAKIVSVLQESTNGDGAEANLMRRIVDSFGEYERLIIKNRIHKAMQAKRTRNEFVGTVPYGKRLQADGVHLEDEPEELAILEQIRVLRSTGMRARYIAEHLNDRGFLNRERQWNAKSIRIRFKILDKKK